MIALLDGKTDQAIERLSRAAEIVPRNAIVASDLAAARLQRGALRSDGEDFFRALVSANRAVHLRPDLLEAHFNRALALQHLSLYQRARGEWDIYLRTERDPDWKRVAKEHSDAITRISERPGKEVSLEAAQQAVERGDSLQLRKLVAASPQLFREYAGGKLLVDWAEAEAMRDEAEARRLLAISRALGRVLAEMKGEHMVADTVSHIEALRRNDSAGLFRLVRAFQDYGQGMSQAEKSDFRGAASSFQTSHRTFAALHSPFAGWSTVWIAVCKYQHSKYGEALPLLESLSGKEVRDRYPALHGRARWIVGLIKIIEGDPTAAVNAYQAALADFQRLGEATNGARVAAQVALGLDYLGRRNEVWRLIYPSLREVATLDVPASRISICESASWLAKVEGEKEIALFFQEEAVRSAVADGTAYKVVLALKVRAEVLAALGRNWAAERDLSVARQTLNEIPDLATRQSLASDINLTAAQLASSPREAISWLDAAIRAYRSASFHYRLAEALSLRARSWEALGETERAERDLTEALSEFEQQRETIPGPEERVSYYDRAREALNAMIWLQMERRRQPQAAFRYSEQAKARSLLDWIQIDPAGGATSMVSPAGKVDADPLSIRRSLPHGTTVIEYASLPQGLVVWTLRRDAFHTEKVPVEAQALEKLVYRLKDDLEQRRREDFLETSARLYDLLIRPVADHLPAGERLVVVPDGPLHALPFALLQDGRIGRYLIQDHICSLAPSARVLLASLRRDRDLANPLSPKALFVLDPAFDQTLFPLPRLKTRKVKAGFIELFPGSLLLEDRTATRQAVLGQADGFEIFHFGGHSLVNAEYPLLSQMLFAAEPGDPARGILYTRDILKQRFQRTRLAVLASCNSAGGRISQTEGVESLARPFLAAGVPAVAASLWPVDNEVSTAFFNRFYVHLKRDFDPAGALQKTQMEWLQQGKGELSDPRLWGAFELIGGTSTVEASGN